MGPGALPTQSDSDTSLTEALRSRGFYKVDADSEHVTVHYKLHPYGDRTQQFDFNNLPSVTLKGGFYTVVLGDPMLLAFSSLTSFVVLRS